MSVSLTSSGAICASSSIPIPFSFSWKDRKKQILQHIEAGEKDALAKIQDKDLKPDVRRGLEREIRSRIDELQKKVNRFEASGLFDAADLESTVRNGINSLINSVRVSAENASAHERSREEGERKSRAFRAAVGGSSIDFSAFVPSSKDAGKIATAL